MYGKIIEGVLQYAPETITIEGKTVCNPTGDQLSASGYYPIQTAERPGDNYTPTYRLDGGAIVQEWIDSRTLGEVQSSKLSELSDACDAAINDGITITTEDGVERHFAGDEQDQINIDQVLRACAGGAPGWLYQSEGSDGQAGECFWCTETDAKKISNGLAIDKTKKRTYHNLMKKYVLQLTTVEEVLDVQWGQPLTGQWLEEFNTKMGLLTPIIESMGGDGNAGG